MPVATRSTAPNRSARRSARGSTRTPASRSPPTRSSTACGIPIGRLPRRSRARTARHASTPRCAVRRRTASRGCVADLARFVGEMRRPTVVSEATRDLAFTSTFPDLSGIVPGVGRFAPCPWGLGFELRGDKSPHWTGDRQFAAHGRPLRWRRHDVLVRSGSSTSALVALTDRPFDTWALDAWPVLGRRCPTQFVEYAAARRPEIADDVQPRRSDPLRDHRRRRTPARPLRVRRRGQRRRRTDRGDARRRTRRRRRRSDGDRAGPHVATSPSSSPVPTCSTIRRCARASSTCGPPRPRPPASRSPALQCIGTGVRDSSEGYALAELSSGGDQYVLRATLCAHDRDAVLVRADRPNRWERR